jgi:hypothetical protein
VEFAIIPEYAPCDERQPTIAVPILVLFDAQRKFVARVRALLLR